ncbi:hypothetical protein Pint_06931 [Pistacia integerrima]|uniref:Uncharacterized protein n=1 Tax=Pistacia integerrima TaxID=434235 RepID=A0ACC0XUD4_9ROSI|nr:hypothetical protein Pint_06931 [Pistacia integerrima]
MNDSFEQVKCRANKLKPEMLAMDIKTFGRGTCSSSIR